MCSKCQSTWETIFKRNSQGNFQIHGGFTEPKWFNGDWHSPWKYNWYTITKILTFFLTVQFLTLAHYLQVVSFLYQRSDQICLVWSLKLIAWTPCDCLEVQVFPSLWRSNSVWYNVSLKYRNIQCLYNPVSL